MYQDSVLGYASGQITNCEAFCTRVSTKAQKCLHDERNVRGVTPEVRSLQRHMQALQQQMRRGMNLTIRDESEDKREGEEQIDQRFKF